MENATLYMTLAQVVLPKDLLENFEISKIETQSDTIHFHLDERMNANLSKDPNFESKGFTDVSSITDFPIRDHKVILKLRRRRWLDVRTGKSFQLPLQIAAEGARYSKEFAAFLKETYGFIPRDLPYA
jgi:transposase